MNTSVTRTTGSPTLRPSRAKLSQMNDQRTVTELVRDISGITFNNEPTSPDKVTAAARNKNSVKSAVAKSQTTTKKNSKASTANDASMVSRRTFS